MSRILAAFGMAAFGMAAFGMAALVIVGCGGDGDVVRGDAAAGARVYGSFCATCHGPGGLGVADAGPPLVDPMYGEAVYPDERLVDAIRNGAISDAWDYPIMPAVPGLDPGALGDVLAFVRALQRADA